MRSRFLRFIPLYVALLTPRGGWAASTSANFDVSVTAAQSIASISLSNTRFPGGAASGTVVGSISVTMSPTLPAFSGTLSLTGQNAGNFQIVGSNLVTNGTNATGTYAISIVGSEPGTSGSPFAQAETITATSGPSACIAQTYTYNLVTDFGAVSGGSTSTNDAALSAFNVEAQRRTRPIEPGYAGGANGAGNPYPGASKDNCIVLNIPAGIYQYSWNRFGIYIGHLKIVGAGSDLTSGSPTSVQNTNNDGWYVHEQAFYHNDYFDPAYTGGATNLGYFINSIDIGATSATLENAANAGNFYVGRWILIASYDQQFQGYPPNFRYYDWAMVTSINNSTGVITWDTPTQFAHLSTRPYVGGALTDGPTGTVGPARVIPIDTPQYPVGVYHEYDGLHVLANPNYNLPSQVDNDCWGVTGLIDGSANDIHDDESMCFTQARNFTISNSQWQEDESDKVISTLTFNNDNVTGGSFSHAGELLWQVNGGVIGGNSNGFNGNTMMARNANYQGVFIDAMIQNCADWVAGIFLDTQLAFTNSITVNNVTFKGNGCTQNFPITAPNRTGNTQTVDGTVVRSVTGPNGPGTRLQIQRSGTYGSPYWVADTQFGEGSSIWKNGSLVAGASITAITGDANYLYLDVTGTTFATGDTFWGPRVESISVTNNVGQTTGFNWASPNIHYPGGISIPNVTWTNNSGN
jgi:hypothetical protein